MKHFFKTNFLLTALLLAAQGLPAMQIDNEHCLSFGASLGAVYGQSEEIVFLNSRSSDKISQLLWDLKPLVYSGLSLQYNYQSNARTTGFFAGGSVKFGFPAKTGVMEDRDWTDLRYSDWLTNYSVHDNKTEKTILADFNIGLSFRIKENHYIKPFISYGFMWYKWSASGGSFLYPKAEDGSEGHAYATNPIQVITYEQRWNTVSIGLAFSGAFNDYFFCDIGFKFSPLIWCNTVDNHILRYLVISDKLKGGLAFEPSFALTFMPKNYLSFELSLAYKNISGTRGDAFYDYSDGKTADISAKNQGGVGYSAFDVGITVKGHIQ